MRISDWSSDVCSSDLQKHAVSLRVSASLREPFFSFFAPSHDSLFVLFTVLQPLIQIGRASCRERVCQYVSISVVAVSLKKTTILTTISQNEQRHYDTHTTNNSVTSKNTRYTTN